MTYKVERAKHINDVIEKFNNNGVVCLRGVFDDYWLKLVEHGVKKNMQSPSKWHDWIVDKENGGVYFKDLRAFNYKNIFSTAEFQ